MRVVHAVVETIWNLMRSIHPEYCVFCGVDLVVPGGLCLCRSCRSYFISDWKKLHKGSESALEVVYFFDRYRSRGKLLLQLYKGSGIRRLDLHFAGAVYRFLKGAARPYVVIGVPGSAAGMRRRGWDQISVILKHLSARGVSLSTGCIVSRKRSTQKHLNRSQRAANTQAAFGWRGDPPVGLDLLLIDDVYTTGATLESCAALLRNLGARSVSALVFFRD